MPELARLAQAGFPRARSLRRDRQPGCQRL